MTLAAFPFLLPLNGFGLRNFPPFLSYKSQFFFLVLHLPRLAGLARPRGATQPAGTGYHRTLSPP